MQSFAFRKGLRFHRGNCALTVVRRLLDKRLQLEAEDGELLQFKEAELMAMMKRGEISVDLDHMFMVEAPVLVVTRDLGSFPAHHREMAERRMHYVEGMRGLGIECSSPSVLRDVIQKVASTIGDQNPPSPVSLYRWLNRYKRGGSALSLVNRSERCGRRRNWAPEAEAALDEAISTVYLNQQRHPKKAVVEYVQRCLAREGKSHLVPSRASLYRSLAEIEAYQVALSREGAIAGQRRFRSVIGVQKAERILERVEIDHTPLNLLVYCPESQLPIGRPYLTIAIDKFSRLVVGYYISFSEPSAYSVLQCLRQSMLPKDELLSPYPDITAPWPARGIPETIVCDNGMELHSKALSDACFELGVQLQFCPAKRPEYKGAVERFFRTINHQLIHDLPGTVFSSPKERGDYPSENLAAISFEALNHLVLKWIVEIYAVTPHRGIGLKRPLEQWQKGEEQTILNHPAEPAQLDVILGHSAEKPVFHYGVEINSLRYNNTELQLLRRRYGEGLRVALKFHKDDLGKVYVFDADRKVYFAVPAIDQDYAAGLRMEVHDLIRAKGRYKANDPHMIRTLLEKKQELQEIVAKSVSDKKMRRRKRASAIKGVNTSRSDIRSADVLSLLPPVLVSADDGPLPELTVRRRGAGGQERHRNE